MTKFPEKLGRSLDVHYKNASAEDHDKAGEISYNESIRAAAAKNRPVSRVHWQNYEYHKQRAQEKRSVKEDTMIKKIALKMLSEGRGRAEISKDEYDRLKAAHVKRANQGTGYHADTNHVYQTAAGHTAVQTWAHAKHGDLTSVVVTHDPAGKKYEKYLKEETLDERGNPTKADIDDIGKHHSARMTKGSPNSGYHAIMRNRASRLKNLRDGTGPNPGMNRKMALKYAGEDSRKAKELKEGKKVLTDDDHIMKLHDAHEREGNRRKAEFHNFGWGEDGDGEHDAISSKTSRGILQSVRHRKTGKITHDWDD